MCHVFTPKRGGFYFYWLSINSLAVRTFYSIFKRLYNCNKNRTSPDIHTWICDVFVPCSIVPVASLLVLWKSKARPSHHDHNNRQTSVFLLDYVDDYLCVCRFLLLKRHISWYLYVTSIEYVKSTHAEHCFLLDSHSCLSELLKDRDFIFTIE